MPSTGIILPEVADPVSTFWNNINSTIDGFPLSFGSFEWDLASTERLRVINFDLSGIPEDALFTGMKLYVIHAADTPASVSGTVSLWTGSEELIVTNKAVTVSSVTAAQEILGSSGDRWHPSVDLDFIKATGFGFTLKYNSTGAFGFVKVYDVRGEFFFQIPGQPSGMAKVWKYLLTGGDL